MLILHTAHSYAPEVSGVAEVVKQLSVRLARRGHEVHVATKQFGDSSAEELLDGVHVHRFDVDGNTALGMSGAVDSYVRFVRSMAWDVVAFHCAQTWTTDALLPHLGTIEAPKIFVGHGFSALADPRYQTYFSELAVALRQVNRIVALSDLLEEPTYCASHSLRAPTIIPNGVDAAEWSAPTRDVRMRWGIKDRPWILSVSNHSPVKGHKAFFEVVQQVRRQAPRAVGTIVGGHYPAAYRGMGRLGIKGGCWYRCNVASVFEAGIELRKSVPRSETVSAIKEANVILVTSSREASPLVVLESMAAGTPWVSFDVGCVREHVGGIVVESPQEMVSAAVDLLGNPALCRELGQAGQARVSEKHDWERIAAQYERLYESCR